MIALYRNIKARRKAAKMTQEELAKRTGYTDRSSIARIEKGEIDLPQSKIKQFADALGTTPAQLFGWDAEPEDLGALAARIIADRDLLRIVRNYMALNDADRYALLLMSDSLAAKNKKD